MNNLTVGIDCGSTSCKGALYDGKNIVATSILPTGWSPRKSCQQVLQDLLSQTPQKREDVYIVSTGYGRMAFEHADKMVTEITCHALGAQYLYPGVATVLDIGGQDCKAIAVKEGKVLSFQMNDKCAAGTGRFIEMTAARLGIELDELGKMYQPDKIRSINSMCAVFAESEIVGLLAEGADREEIVGGVIHSVASRVHALAARLPQNSPILLTGGLSHLPGVQQALSCCFQSPIITVPYSQLAGAIGAALTAKSE